MVEDPRETVGDPSDQQVESPSSETDDTGGFVGSAPDAEEKVNTDLRKLICQVEASTHIPASDKPHIVSFLKEHFPAYARPQAVAMSAIVRVPVFRKYYWKFAAALWLMGLPAIVMFLLAGLPTSEISTAYIGYFAGTSIVPAVIVASLLPFARHSRNIVIAGSLLISGWMVSKWHVTSSSAVQVGLLSGLAAVWLFVLLSIALSYRYAKSVKSAIVRARREQPKAFLVETSIQLIRQIEKARQDSKSDVRDRLIGKLLDLEKGISYQFKELAKASHAKKDPDLDSRCLKCRQAIAGAKMHVLVPDAQSYDKLSSIALTVINVAVTEHWGMLPESDAIVMVAGGQNKRLVLWTRFFLATLLPICVVFGADRLGWLPSKLADQSYLATFGWAVLSLAQLIHPGVGSFLKNATNYANPFD